MYEEKLNGIEPSGYRQILAFLLLLSLALLFDRSGLAVGCICAALLHELGHLLAMAVCGVSVTAVCLCPLGVRIERAAAPSLHRELFVNLSGPMFNLLLALVLYCAGKFFPFRLSTVHWDCSSFVRCLRWTAGRHCFA